MYSRLSLQQERRWAMLAHLTLLANLFTILLGTLGALIIYLAFKKRSYYVAYHALQALFFQLIAWVGFGAAALLLFVLARLVGGVGVCLMVVAFLLALVPLLSVMYAAFAASEVQRGRDFAYYKTGEWALDIINK